MHRILTFLLLISCAACSMQQDIEVVLPEQAAIPFIECYLEPSVPVRALATESVGFFESAEITPLDGLSFMLYRDGEPLLLENEYLIDSVHSNVFNYVSKDTVQYQEGSTWELVVHRQEEEIARGEARFLPKPVIKDIRYTLSADSLVALEVVLEDKPEEKNYYRLRIRAKEEFAGNGYRAIYTDQQANKGLLTFRANYALSSLNDTLLVTVYHLDESYYTYLRSLQKAFDANYNPFAQPANIESNVQGKAMGVFTAISGASKEVYIKR